MRLLMIGDVVGPEGCDFLRQKLPLIRRQMGVELVVANGENAARGNGLLPQSAEHLFDSGVDVLTSGNHIFRRREIYPILEEEGPLLRPENYPSQNPGKGVYLYDGGAFQVLIVNLLGVSFMEPLESPFLAADRILSTPEARDARFIIVDFHAEATGEKKALGYYLDGRVSVVAGTHTHIPTADEQILPGGTGYITDLGMTGPGDSVLGVAPQCVIRRFVTSMPTRFEPPEGSPCVMQGCLFDLSRETGRCESVTRLEIR